MIRSLWTAATGMGAQQLNMDVIAHNLSNANTTGYKQSRANFEDLMYQNIIPPGAKTSNDAQLPVGVQVGMERKPFPFRKISLREILWKPATNLILQLKAKVFSRCCEDRKRSIHAQQLQVE
jgi:flagellar basal-body rod protein FlgG